MLGESSALLLAAEDEIAIRVDIKDAAGSLDQFDVDVHRVLDCVRQTGGPWLIVSHPAVFNADLHALLSPSGSHSSVRVPRERSAKLPAERLLDAATSPCQLRIRHGT